MPSCVAVLQLNRRRMLEGLSLSDAALTVAYNIEIQDIPDGNTVDVAVVAPGQKKGHVRRMVGRRKDGGGTSAKLNFYDLDNNNSLYQSTTNGDLSISTVQNPKAVLPSGNDARFTIANTTGSSIRYGGELMVSWVPDTF